MATEVVMPQMGESIAEGTITRWLKQVGERVERDEPLFEISTDKVDAEIPSPAAGTLTQVLFKEGDTVEVNKVVAYIGEAGEAAAPSEPAPQAEAPKQEAAAASAAPASQAAVSAPAPPPPAPAPPSAPAPEQRAAAPQPSAPPATPSPAPAQSGVSAPQAGGAPPQPSQDARPGAESTAE